MIELFIIALIFTIFAVVQDLKTREVANWINFSLIATALAFRAFYATINHNLNFFLFGLIGVAAFTILAYGFYYGKAFAGGDAKLLMGFGAILPYNSFSEILPLSIIFIILLFISGAIYSLIYSTFIAIKKRKQFNPELKKQIKQKYKLLTTSPIAFILLILILKQFNQLNNLTVASTIILLLIMPWIWIYTKSLDNCMIKKLPPSKLTEGDWIEEDIKHNGKTIVKKTVHGLSYKDIQKLKELNLSIEIKEGVPFTPAFLIALIITALAYSTLLHYFQNLSFLL